MDCKEIFLSDAIRIQFYETSKLVFPVPPTIPNLRSLNRLQSMPQSLLDVHLNDGEVNAVNINVKQTPRLSGSNLTYIYNVDANIDQGIDVVSQAVPYMMANDCHVLLTLADGSMRLLYALPCTFAVEASSNLKELPLKISLSSANDFISIV